MESMETMSSLRIGIFILLTIIMAGCARTVAIEESERYDGQGVTITTKDSTTYDLASGWKVDSLHNVSGRGLRTRGDISEAFKGTIQSSIIERLSVVDSVTPAIVIIMGAAVAMSVIWLGFGAPN